jgi:hypothetical protein
MNVMTARHIAEHVAELKGISASFTAHYGANYCMTEESPRNAIELYRMSMSIQAKIISLLHPEALNQAYSRYGNWWERAEMIPPSIVNEIATTVFELIGRCAYAEDPETGDIALHNTLVLEQCIAGMLHPSTHITALEHVHEVRNTMGDAV